MEFEERLCCFVDLLGFKSAVDQCVEDDRVRAGMYIVINEICSGELERHAYSSIPVVENGKVVSAGSLFGADVVGRFKEEIKMEVTQFSDSFVISAPVDNVPACEMLLRSIYILHLHFFFNIGMMMRGGLTVGKLIHTKNGPLFGPAMNDAYELESKFASYPRVVVSPEAKKLVDVTLNGMDVLKHLKVGFDGLICFDLVNIFSWTGTKKHLKSEIEKRLKEVEADVLEIEPKAHPKIAFLLDRWEQEKHNFE